MKKTITKLSFVLVTVVLTATSALAHFGSKGPYGGGTVTSYVVNKDTIYVGTANGGVYAATWTKGAVVANDSILSNWSAKPVGLKSGKIVSLTHTGKYAIAATADSGIFRFSGYVGSDRYWVKINKGLTTLDITSVIALDATTLIAGTTTGKIYRSTDLGNNWTEVTNVTFAGSKIIGFDRSPNRLFVLTENKGVYVSLNKGENWSSFNDKNTQNLNGALSIVFSQNDSTLIISTENTLYAISDTATEISYLSVPLSVKIKKIILNEDGSDGLFITEKGLGIPNDPFESYNYNLTDSLNINFVIFHKNQIYACVEKNGIYRLNQKDSTWIATNTGFNNQKTNSFASNGTQIIFVATERGVFFTKDLGQNYVRVNKGLTDSLHVNDLAIFGSKVFAVTENAGVFVSADSGKVWSAFNTGLSLTNYVNIYASKNFIYAIDEAANIYQSNGKDGWNAIQKGLPVDVEYYVLSFYKDKVYAAAHGGGVFWKNEENGDWNNITSNLPTTHTTAITVLGTKIYVGTHHEGVFISDIHNIDWKTTAKTSIDHTVTMNLDGDGIQAMANYGGYVFASYKGGLLATKDNGKTWERGGNQFNLPSFTDVNKIGFAGERVFVTTENNCIYSNALSEVPLNVAFQEVKEATCDNKAGELSIAFTGGTAFTAPAAPYKIKWSTGDTTLSVSNLSVGNYWVEITDKNGATSKDSIQLFKEACANVSELELANTFQVYPNPAKSNFTINSSSAVNNIHIYNELGTLVKAIENVNVTNYEVKTSFEKGVYFIYATSEVGTHVQKLIID